MVNRNLRRYASDKKKITRDGLKVKSLDALCFSRTVYYRQKFIQLAQTYLKLKWNI